MYWLTRSGLVNRLLLTMRIGVYDDVLDFCWCVGGDDFAADSQDGRGARGLDDAADGRWPMVMELFTKMQKLMLAAAAMLLLAMLPLMLHLSGRAATVEHCKACLVSTVVQAFLVVYNCNGQVLGSTTVQSLIWITNNFFFNIWNKCIYSC